MPTESTLLLTGLFVLAAASGWLFARYSSWRDPEEDSHELSEDYFRGLNYLLNERQDEALEVFARMVEVDDETVDTHFALGSLFRRRGEVAKAIRIHQNLIARPNLSREHRDQALFALAEDYLRAGLLDRAENLFGQLSDKGSYRERAAAKLVRIYEQEKEWQKAIDAHGKLVSIAGDQADSQVAHYYCELAEQAAAAKDYARARQYLKQSQSRQTRTTRGALMRADIARESEDYQLALRLYRQVLDQSPDLTPDVLPNFASCYEATDSSGDLSDALRSLIKENPKIGPDIAYAAIVHELYDDPVARECIVEFVEQQATLKGLLEACGAKGGDWLMDSDVLNKLCRALKHLAESAPKYSCRECGFSSGIMYWQCPTCKTWDTIRPVARFQYEALLYLGGGRPPAKATGW